MNKFPKFNNFNRNFGVVSQCPLCNEKVTDVKVIEEINNSFLMHSKCSKCGNAILLIATINDFGANIIGINTDLSVDEVIKFRSTDDCVTTDDVIEIHKGLQDNTLLEEVIRQ